MSIQKKSIAMTGDVDAAARRHLLRSDRQEDVCFALWHPSQGKNRESALIQRLILPVDGERNVHGNVSFEPGFFTRALMEAKAEHAGLALLHSHPGGHGWQGMSKDDISAEQDHAAAVFGATKRPFIGLTVAGGGEWSARFWGRVAHREYKKTDCSSVRVVGKQMKVHYYDKMEPAPKSTKAQVRTISSWGEECQRNLVRLKVGIIGVGSVGGVIAEALGRTGFQNILLLDFDKVEECNLDRLQYATRKDVGRLKVEVLAERLRDISTADYVKIETIDAAVYTEDGFRSALDCDILFSCVDRPWGRYVLNIMANAHLIPVFDGGIAVGVHASGKLRSADWRAHTVIPGRACLECLGQYDPAGVSLEREGFFDDPAYIEGLPRDSMLKARENVYAFALSCGSMQVLQMLSYVIAPSGLSDPGQQLYHFVNGKMETPQHELCKGDCAFSPLVALGDDCNILVTVKQEPTVLRQRTWKERLWLLMSRWLHL